MPTKYMYKSFRIVKTTTQHCTARRIYIAALKCVASELHNQIWGRRYAGKRAKSAGSLLASIPSGAGRCSRAVALADANASAPGRRSACGEAAACALRSLSQGYARSEFRDALFETRVQRFRGSFLSKKTRGIQRQARLICSTVSRSFLVHVQDRPPTRFTLLMID